MVNVIITSDPRYKGSKEGIKSSILKVLEEHNVFGNIEVEVAIVGDRKMKEFNKKYRGLDETTDVLSFCLGEGGSTGFISVPDGVSRFGLIAVSYPQAVVNASEDGKSMEEEINFLVSHGVTHLLGIHHD